MIRIKQNLTFGILSLTNPDPDSDCWEMLDPGTNFTSCSSVSDPDSIRSVEPDPGGQKMTHKNRNKLRNFMF